MPGVQRLALADPSRWVSSVALAVGGSGSGYIVAGDELGVVSLWQLTGLGVPLAKAGRWGTRINMRHVAPRG